MNRCGRILCAFITSIVLLTSGCDCGNAVPRHGMWIIGHMEADPERAVASGSLEARIVIRAIMIVDDVPEPVEGGDIQIFSSRNQGDDVVDIVQQPTEKTDDFGQTEARIGSFVPGESVFTAILNGSILCADRVDGKCVPLKLTMNFSTPCINHQDTFCDGECINLQTDPDNCGSCGNGCRHYEFCDSGICTMGDCDKDSDGYIDEACDGNDCDDQDANIFPGAFEECDGKDNDCDGETDEDQDVCDDYNECTDDVCERGQGCVNILLVGEPCLPLDDCYDNYVCRPSGICEGTPIDRDGDGYSPPPCGDDCDDGNSHVSPGEDEIGRGTGLKCGDGLDNDCDGLTDMEDPGCCGCAADAYCDDGNPCNGVEWCDIETCICYGGWMPDCDDNNDCTDDSCVPTDGSCSHSPVADDTACEDGDPCTLYDVCGGGVCISSTDVLDCDDGNPCTDDICVSEDRSCRYENNTIPCDDNNVCTSYSACADGVCQAGTVTIDCSDGNQCTEDICDPATGACSNPERPVGFPCDDGDPCTSQDDCQGLLCQGTWYDCDDGDLCTINVCNGDGTCSYRPGPDRTHPFYSCPEVRCDGVDNDCDGCTDEGCPGYSGTVVSVEVIPYSDQPGLRRLSGNGQAAPHGTTLPNRFIIQVNDDLGNPLPCTDVVFAIEPAGTVCYGRGGTFQSPYMNPVEIPLLCNTVENGTLIGDAVTITNDNGQASIGLQLPADEVGLVAVSAMANGETTYFHASSGTRLTDVITVPSSGQVPPNNPALGPLAVTNTPEDTDVESYLADISNYTLAITGLSATTGSIDGVAAAPIEGSVDTMEFLTIEGVGFSNTGNTVWIGNWQAGIISESPTSITVGIYDGIPGATWVLVDNGTTTPFKTEWGDGGAAIGSIPSIAVAPANFLRTAPKPVFIYRVAGNGGGTETKVKLLGMDACGNPLDLSGRLISLMAAEPRYHPFPASNVSILDLDLSSGLARAVCTSAQGGSAVIIGTVDGISSDSTPGGNMVVSTVNNLLSPPAFNDAGVVFDNGNNAMIARGGDEATSADYARQNPAFTMSATGYETYTIPDGTSAGSETEAHLFMADWTGYGTIANLGPIAEHTLAGSAMLSISGNQNSVLSLTSSVVEFQILSEQQYGSVEFTGIALPGRAGHQSYQSPGYLFEFNFSGLHWLGAEIGPRNLIIRSHLEQEPP